MMYHCCGCSCCTPRCPCCGRRLDGYWPRPWPVYPRPLPYWTPGFAPISPTFVGDAQADVRYALGA